MLKRYLTKGEGSGIICKHFGESEAKGKRKKKKLKRNEKSS